MREFRTDWQALALTLAIPAIVVAGLTHLALEPQWDESDDWLLGLIVLPPFEFVRVVVVRILRDAYRDFHTPWQATRFFLLSLAALAALCLGFALLQAGPVATIEALLEPSTWRIILPPTALIVADGVIGLYFFHGDGRLQAARLDAIADDAEDWLLFAVTRLPFVVAAVYALLILLRARGVAVPAFVPEPGVDAFRELALLLVAFYFAFKAVLVAHAYTAGFARSGRRVLDIGWFQFCLGTQRDARRKAARAEARAAQERRDALAGTAAQDGAGS